MTIEDAKVIGLGSIGLLCLFLFVQLVFLSRRVDLWAAVRHYVIVRITSSDDRTGDAAEARTGADGDAGDAAILVRGQQHQVNDEVDDENASAPASLVLRQLPKTELIILLAVQRKDDGSYLWSANDIKKFIPGADGPIGEVIATVRGKKPAEPAARSIRKNANGDWEPVR